MKDLSSTSGGIYGGCGAGTTTAPLPSVNNYVGVIGQPMRMGWICPKCNRSISPDEKFCNCNCIGYAGTYTGSY